MYVERMISLMGSEDGTPQFSDGVDFMDVSAWRNFFPDEELFDEFVVTYELDSKGEYALGHASPPAIYRVEGPPWRFLPVCFLPKEWAGGRIKRTVMEVK